MAGYLLMRARYARRSVAFAVPTLVSALMRRIAGTLPLARSEKYAETAPEGPG
jgi:hypothetical protein